MSAKICTDMYGQQAATGQAANRVRDHVLWRAGQRLAASHRACGENRDRCGDPRCAGAYPCLGRRIADQAIDASQREWPHRWTAEHDLRSYETALRATGRRR